MPAFRRAEVWSDLQCAGGARLAAIPDLLALADDRKLSGEDELTLTLPVSSPATSTLLERRVVRVVTADDAFDEWRITDIDEQENARGRTVLVKAAAPTIDLARVVLGRVEANGIAYHDFEIIGMTPTDYLTTIVLPALAAEGYSYYALGTIEAMLPVDLVHDWDTVQAVVKRLADVTVTEFHLRRNGTTQYLIDLLALTGAGAPTVYVTLGKNLRGVQRQRSTVDQATRVYARGTAEDGIRPTMARALWEVVSVVGSVVRVKDPAGGDGPAQFADQLNGSYLRKTSGTLTQITATAVVSAALTDLTVASTTSISAGQLLEIRRTSAGDDVTFLEQPADKATYGLIPKVLDRPDIPGVNNAVVNPAMRNWAGASSAPPDNWTKLSTPTLTRTTTAARWRVGGKSCRVESTADGQGLETNYVTVTPTAEKPFFSGFLSFWLESGQVRVELVATDGVTTWVIPEGTENKASSNEQKTWVDLGVAGIDLKALGTGVTQAKLRIVQDGAGTADFYVDSGQIVNEAGQQPFADGVGATKLWQAANEDLLAHSRPEVRIDVDLLDLARLHPTVWPDDTLVMGGNVKVQDGPLGVNVTTRVLEIKRDLLIPATTQVVLSTRPDDLTDALVRPRKAPRKNRLADLVPPELSVDAFVSAVPATQGTFQVQLAARPATAKIFYTMQTIGSVPPPIGSSVYTQYVNVFTVTQVFSTEQQVVAYAQLGDRRSQVRVWKIGQANAISHNLTLSEDPALTLVASWLVTHPVEEILLFEKVGGWPTTNGLSDGPLDWAQFWARMKIRRDLGGWDIAGAPIPGGVRRTKAGYANGNDVRVISVVIDYWGNTGSGSPTSRLAQSRTMANAQSPLISAFTVARTRDGTGCDGSTEAQNTISWTPNAAVLNTDVINIFFYRNGGPPIQILGQTDPTAPTTLVHGIDDFLSATGPEWHMRYGYTLTRAGNIIDTGLADISYQVSGTCPI